MAATVSPVLSDSRGATVRGSCSTWLPDASAVSRWLCGRSCASCRGSILPRQWRTRAFCYRRKRPRPAVNWPLWKWRRCSPPKPTRPSVTFISGSAGRGALERCAWRGISCSTSTSAAISPDSGCSTFHPVPATRDHHHRPHPRRPDAHSHRGEHARRRRRRDRGVLGVRRLGPRRDRARAAVRADRARRDGSLSNGARDPTHPNAHRLPRLLAKGFAAGVGHRRRIAMSDKAGEYISGLFGAEDELLASLREEADRTGLPPIAISADEGRLLQVLLTAIGARRVLEVGTLGGYSAICMARALPPGGKLLSVEIDEAHAAFARRYIERATLSDRVEIRVGRALDVLPSLDGERFDAIFLDADKEPLPTYFEWGLRLVRPGGLLIGDNALWGGRVYENDNADDRTRGVREFNRRMATDPRVLGIIVPTHDGVAVAVVR